MEMVWHKWIGERVPRIDGYEKVTGKALFFSDIDFPNMLHAAILRSPHPHARVVSIDASKATRLPGVVTVITREDVPPTAYGPQRPDRNVLAFDKVRFVGDEVAAVAAIDLDAAKEALSAIEVSYEVLPAVLDPEEAMRSDSIRVHDDVPHNIASHSKIIRGKGREGFAECEVIVEDEFVTQRVHCLYMEPQLCVVYPELENSLTIYLPVQTPFLWRAQIAKVFDLPLNKVRIRQVHMGGAFGGKLDTSIAMIAVALALKTGRPIKLSNTIDDELGYGFHRVSTKIWMRIGAKRDGTLIAKQVHIIADNGAYNSLAPKIVCTNMATRSDCLYRYKHVETEAYLVYTNKVPTSAYRGYGNPQITFAQESLLDELAKELGIDPVELRLKNIHNTGETTVHGWQIRSTGLAQCLKEGAKAIDWGKPKLPYQGRGVACMIHVSGNRGVLDWDGSETLIRLHEDGSIVVLSGESELGQGAHTVLAQIVAEELGVSLDSIKVLQVDTDVSPFALGPYSTKTTVLAGNATRQAAQELKRKIFEKAEQMLGIPRSRLELTDGKIVADNVEVTLKELMSWCHRQEGRETLIAHGVFEPGKVRISADNDFYGDISATYPLAAHFAEVQVDPETGQVTVTRYVAAHDIGKVINYEGTKGQIFGGVLQGLGYALMEEIIYENGAVKNMNLRDYLIPTSLDVPAVAALLIESYDPVGPYGAKGIGEPTLIPVAAAIANAIYDAVGIRFRELPITSEKVFTALQKRGWNK
ncbi:MAG: xanthine dehydrogenase family protein molybdopterin-binding subunit [Deltaproteobacteria bacterium]|nr:MAG: xanthine dehydrogenase family protein molybdopterin-binding subunit [Deltaproteobacteria bacterium]